MRRTRQMLRLSIAFGLFAVMAAPFLASWQVAADDIATMRGATALTEQEAPPRMMPFVNNDLREARNYPEQPPIIPHKTDDYVVDLNSNKCLSCHARSRTQESQAPMVSITHFMDRDGQFRASVSPRRYFCSQCHVSQREVKPLVENHFVDVDSLLQKRAN